MRSTISVFATIALPGRLPAALGLHLILDVHGARAGGDQRSNGARDVERAPESGVGIHQKRQPGHARDPPHVRQHVLESRDTQIRHSERAAATPPPDR